MSNPAPYRLPSDAVWFITGCSSGIGFNLASHIAKTSNHVVATARKLPALSSLPDGANVLKLALDVTSKASIDAATKATLAKFGRIDVVVNNAGYGLYGDTESTTDEQARKQLDTNFWGAVDMTKEAMRIMREENPKTGPQGGVVVQISSMGGRIGFPGGAFYHASKFALEGFTESVAKEVHPDWNIHFSIIEPGGVKTEFAGSSMVHVERHPAYTDPTCPTNVLRAYMADPKMTENWGDAGSIAEVIYEVVGSGKGIPLRLPLGMDSWGLLKSEVKRTGGELDGLKNISERTSGSAQLDSVDFLKK